ncbi:MAG: hypothetical protein U1F43_00970 [Myxococcota bacterium]
MTVASRLVALLLGLGATTGCAHYVGHARTIDAASIEPGAGWIMAAPTPTVLQAGRVDCGPAALAMIAGRWL